MFAGQKCPLPPSAAVSDLVWSVVLPKTADILIKNPKLKKIYKIKIIPLVLVNNISKAQSYCLTRF